MIKSVTITNHLAESIKLELGRPELSGFLVQAIDGLGPGKSTINSVDIPTGDGSVFNSARLPSRNIILRLLFLEYPTIEHTRQMSYKYFPIKKRIKLLIETDNRVCEIYGNVESNEPSIFSKEEGTQISIICPDPYFYSIENNAVVFSGIEPVFEFDFANESLVENLLEFGTIENQTMQTVYYQGDAEVGIVINLHALGEATNIAIYNADTHEMMNIDTNRLATLTGQGITAGDDIIISTIRGDKHIWLLREGLYYNILNCLGRNADWFQLSKGDNIFAYTADSGLTNLQFRIDFRMVYEGV